MRKTEVASFSWWLQFILLSNFRSSGRFPSCVDNIYVQVLIQHLFFWQMCSLGPALFSSAEFASGFHKDYFRASLVVWDQFWFGPEHDKNRAPIPNGICPRWQGTPILLTFILIRKRLFLMSLIKHYSNPRLIVLSILFHFDTTCYLFRLWLGFDIYLCKTF